jgi:hypothetical protein
MNRVPLLFLSLVLILPDALAAEENIALATRTGSLHGTLSLANPPAPGPVVLLIAGSGPTDRDGNSSLLPGRNDHLKLLAEALGSRGISSLRYDKRGVAQSVAAAGRENDLRFETYVDDAVAWAERIKNDSRFSSLTIIGHSEGSLIGMIATQRVTAAGFVSLAGPGRAAPDRTRATSRSPQAGGTSGSDPGRTRSRPDDRFGSSRAPEPLSPERPALPDLLVPLRPGERDRQGHDSRPHCAGVHRSAGIA